MWHPFWHWVYFNSPTIEASCAVFGVIGLAFYAAETQKIRRATLAQSQASRRPFFKLKFTDIEGHSVCALENVGAGIALNVEWDFFSGSPNLRPVKAGAIPPGTSKVLHYADSDTTPDYLRLRGGVRVAYEDTARKLYWTTVAVRVFENRTSIYIDTGEE